METSIVTLYAGGYYVFRNVFLLMEAYTLRTETYLHIKVSQAQLAMRVFSLAAANKLLDTEHC
jgi:TRAP-type mannitol/chloroaromatic compound transport system permease small subunit